MSGNRKLSFLLSGDQWKPLTLSPPFAICRPPAGGFPARDWCAQPRSQLHLCPDHGSLHSAGIALLSESSLLMLLHLWAHDSLCFSHLREKVSRECKSSGTCRIALIASFGNRAAQGVINAGSLSPRPNSRAMRNWDISCVPGTLSSTIPIHAGRATRQV